jgi:hypothetical protein
MKLFKAVISASLFIVLAKNGHGQASPKNDSSDFRAIDEYVTFICGRLR